MKRQVSPVVVVIVILLVVAALGGWLYKSTAQSIGTADTQLPPDVVKRLKERGPQPMPPMPMPGGGTMNVPTQSGPPTGK